MTTMRRALGIVRTIPTWRVALVLAIALVIVNLAAPGERSTGWMVATAVAFLATLVLLVATRGQEALVLGGLLLVSGWVVRATDFPRAAEMIVFVVALTVLAHLMSEARTGSARGAARTTRS